jgi:hypothetical protein
MSVSQQSPSTRSIPLLEVVERDRDQRCAEITGQARSEARRVIAQAWGAERARLHLEVLETRAAVRHQLLLAQGSLETRRRQARQQADRRLLEQAWPLLREALLRRWRQPETRQAWVEALITQALKRLVDSPWKVEHPSDWPAAERHAVEARLNQVLDPLPVFVAEPALRAGIRVQAGNSVVDGSCDGLLRDRLGIEARLLAEIRTPGYG